MRLAFVSPLPPAATGISDYTIEVLRALAPRHSLTAFHGPEPADSEALPEGVVARAASLLSDASQSSRFDAIVHQLGNGPAHDFQYQVLRSHPGLLVLHDLVLHHSRGRAVLEAPAVRAYARDPASAPKRAAAQSALAEYRELLESVYPGRGEALSAVQLGTTGDLLPYAWPLFEDVVRRARVVAVHNRFMREEVAAAAPGVPVFRVAHPAGRESVSRERVLELRSQLGLGPEHFVVGCFGLLSREKRVETVARAVERLARRRKQVRLLLVGPIPEGSGLEQQLVELGVRDRTVVTGRVPLETLSAHVEAADAVAHLRWPTARETSGALLRVLAQGRPTVISDLEHLDEIPEAAVLRADLADEEGELFRALDRLAESPELRARLGRKAAAFVRTEHSPERTAADYERALEATLQATAAR